MSWIQLSGGDPARYCDLFGWAAADGLFTVDGQVVAGYDDGPESGWTTHLLVDDPAAIAVRIGAAGGRVELRDTRLGPATIVTDPFGARVAVRSGRGPDLVERPGALSWTELCTVDTAAARDFYAGCFGWDPVTVPMTLPGGIVPYTVFCADGKEVAGLMPHGPFPLPGPPRWLPYVQVADCAATARALGPAVLVPPFDIPDIGRVAVLTDTLAIIQLP